MKLRELVTDTTYKQIQSRLYMEKQDYQNKMISEPVEMSIKEYAELRKVTVGAVYDGLNNNRNQPGLIDVKLIGTHKILVVDKSKVTI